MQAHDLDSHLHDETVIDEDVIALKLRPPTIVARSISRPRLVKKIVDPEIRLAIIVAPAGYGKTILMAEAYAALAEDDQRVAWIHLDEYDNGFNFWICFLEALKRIDPNRDFATLLQASSFEENLDERLQFGWLAPLINQIQAIESPFTLFLDNLHLVKSETVLSMLRQLVDYMPQSMRLVAASREHVNLVAPQLTMRGQVLVIDKEELSFRYAETAEVLGAASGPGPLTGKAWEIQQVTHGWITAIKILGMSYEAMPADFPDMLGKPLLNNTQVFQFLENEAFGRLNPEMRTFLVGLSCLPEISTELCDYVFERDDSADMLHELEKRDFFVHSVSMMDGWFRMHPLFRDYLQTRLSAAGFSQDEVERLHMRAADWFVQNGSRTLALSHLLAAHDYDRYLDLVDSKYTTRGVNASLVSGLLEPLASVPREFLYKHPSALALYMVGLFHFGQIEEVDSLISDMGNVEDLFHEVDAPGGYDEECALIIGGLLAYDAGDYERAIELFESVFHAPDSGRNDIDGFLMILAARCYMALGHSDEAVVMLRRSLERAQRFHMVDERLASTNELARTLANIGQVRESERVLTDGCRYAADAHEFGDGEVFLEFSLMFLRREWGEPSKIEQTIDHHQNFIARQMENFTGWLQAPDFFLELSNCYWSIGRNDMASACYKITKDHLRNHLQVPYLPSQFMYERAKFWLFTGQGDLLDAWVQVQKAKEWYADRITERLSTLACALGFIQQDQPKQLIDYLLESNIDDSKLLLPSFQIDCALMRAWAQLQIGNRGQAFIHVMDALTRAKRCGFIRMLVDWGPWLLEFVETMRPELPVELHDYISRLLDLGRRVWESPRLVPEWARPMKGLNDFLSARELEVLKLLCEGRTTPDISRTLGVSLSTAKSHVSSIYRKLGVHKRIDAVRKGLKILGLE